MKKLLQLVLFLAALAWCAPAQAQVTYVAAGAINGVGASATDAVAALPANTLINDILIVTCFVRNTADTMAVTDYTQIAQVDTASGSWSWWWKRHDGAEGTATCNSDQTADKSAQQHAFRGVITSGNPWNALGTAEADVAGNNYTVATLTTGAINSMVVVLSGYQDDDEANLTVTGTDPAAYTEVYTEVTTSTSDSAIGVSYAIRATAGATGTITVDFGSTNPDTDPHGTVVLSLQANCASTSFGNGFTCIQYATIADPDSGTAVTATMASNVTAGNQVIVTAFGCQDSTCTGAVTNTVTFSNGTGDSVSLPTTSCGTTPTGRKTCIAIFANVTATTTFTATWSATSWYIQTEAVEFSGGATSSPFDVDASHCGAASGTSVTCTLTSSSTALIYGRLNHQVSESATPGTNFVEILDPVTTIEVEAKSNTSGANDCTWSWASTAQNQGVCIAMKQVGGGPPAASPRLTLIGVGD